jgi:hypothetical protein
MKWVSVLLAMGLGPEQALHVTASVEVCLRQLRMCSVVMPLLAGVLRRS